MKQSGKSLKITSITLVLAIICIVFAGCNSHEHTWKDATCTDPKTCTECGETEGEPLGHKWSDANCTEPKTCTVCGAKEGDPKGHTWVDATCSSPKKCSVCGATEGEPLGHDVDVSCTEKTTCKRCGAAIDPPGHDWKEATCTEAKTCARCGTIDGKPLGHDGAAPVKENEIAATCTTVGSYEEVVYCTRCHEEVSRVKREIPALGHTSPNGVCERCGKTVIKPVTFTGTGNSVVTDVNIPKGVYKVSGTNNSTSNFIADAYNSEGDDIAGLVNELRTYYGSRLFTEEVMNGYIEVMAKGPWSITFEAIPDGGTSNICGSGNRVTPWFKLKDGALVVKATLTGGDSNFIVDVYDTSGNDVGCVINEIGSGEYTGLFKNGKEGELYCLEVMAEGDWTIDFGLGDEVTYVEGKEPIEVGDSSADGGNSSSDGDNSSSDGGNSSGDSNKWTYSDTSKLNSYAKDASSYALKAFSYAVHAKDNAPLVVINYKNAVQYTSFVKSNLKNIKELAKGKYNFELSTPTANYSNLQEMIDYTIGLCDEIVDLKITRDNYSEYEKKITDVTQSINTECIGIYNLSIKMLEVYAS